MSSEASDMSGPSSVQDTAGEPPSIEWIRAFVGRWLESWNSHQANGVLSLLTEDVEIRDDSWPRTMHGHRADGRSTAPTFTSRGRVAKLRVAFDVMTLARQLGVLPATGSRGESAMAAAQRWTTWVQHEYRRRRSALT